MKVSFAITLVLLAVAVCHGQVYPQPEQIHLAIGASPSQMVVTWVTQTSTNTSVVEYGPLDLSMVAKGVEEVFTDGGSEARKIYMHRVAMTGLTPGKQYYYHVGSPAGWSEIFRFTAMQDGNQWSPRFAVFGDMGNVNAQSLGRLQEEVAHNNFDAILHVGDFAYNLDTNNAHVGDEFMEQIESIAAYLPYMTCVGNHESAYNFSNYAKRFTMPGGDGNNMYFSFDIGPAHIVAFSSEFYYYLQYGAEQIPLQYSWLENDLKEANKPENRAKHPWIITMCHRPMYCSNSDDPEHCPNPENIIRVGMPKVHTFGMEELLYKYAVDLHFQAHEHSYERMWPVYNNTVCNGSYAEPYTDPPGPVHIVTGSAGCQEGVDPFVPMPQNFSAFQSDDYGYTRMTIHNATHLYLEQVSDDQAGKVIDKMMLIKHKHGAHNCLPKN